MDQYFWKPCVLLIFLASTCAAYGVDDVSNMELVPQDVYLVPPMESLDIQCKFIKPVDACQYVIGSEIQVFGPKLKRTNPDDKSDCSVSVNTLDENENMWSCNGMNNVNGELNKYGSKKFQVFVIQKASSVRIFGLQNQLVEDEEVQLTCEARDAKPQPEMKWFIVNDTDILFELSGTPGVAKGNVVSSSLQYIPHYEHNTQYLACAADVLKNDSYFNEYVTMGKVKLDIRYFPKISAMTPNDFLVPATNGNVTIQVFSNPPLMNNGVMWKARGSDIRPGQSKAGLAAEKVKPYFDEGGRSDIYDLTLRIGKLDYTEEYILLVKNEISNNVETSFSFRVAIDNGDSGLGGAQVAAIVVPILIVLIILVLAFVAKRRGLLCFAPNNHFRVRRQRVATSDPDENHLRNNFNVATINQLYSGNNKTQQPPVEHEVSTTVQERSLGCPDSPQLGPPPPLPTVPSPSQNSDV